MFLSAGKALFWIRLSSHLYPVAVGIVIWSHGARLSVVVCSKVVPDFVTKAAQEYFIQKCYTYNNFLVLWVHYSHIVHL